FTVEISTAFHGAPKNRKPCDVPNGKESLMTYEMKPLPCNSAKLRWLRMGFAYLLPQRQTTDQPMGRRPYLLFGWRQSHPRTRYVRTFLPFHMDYGAKAAAYVDAFVGNINWENVSALFRNQVRT